MRCVSEKFITYIIQQNLICVIKNTTSVFTIVHSFFITEMRQYRKRTPPASGIGLLVTHNKARN